MPDGAATSSIRRIAPDPSRAIRQPPANRPSTSTLPRAAPLPGKSGVAWSTSITRVRSLWPSRTLSYSGRKRTGAGTSGPGRGASGRSKSSRSAFVTNDDEAITQALDDRAEPGQAGPVPDVGDGRRPEGGQVAQDEAIGSRIGADRGAEPGLGEGPGGQPAGAPDAPRWDLDERHEMADGGRQRQRVAARPALGKAAGRARRRSAGAPRCRTRASRASSSRSTSTRFRRNGEPRNRWARSGAKTGRRAR